MRMDVHFERFQKPSFECVLDGHVAIDEMVWAVEHVVAFVVNVVLPAEIVAAVNKKAGVGGHLRQTLVADECKDTVIRASEIR